MLRELCRDVAFEAARRSDGVNPHELWAALEEIHDLTPSLIVDVGSDPAVVWAWWSLGATVVSLSRRPAEVPSSVRQVLDDPCATSVWRRGVDQCAGRRPDVLVLAGLHTESGARRAWDTWAPLVRSGGLVLVHGIADERKPGVGQFWASLDAPKSKELVGEVSPDGYGLVQVHGRDRLSHG